MKHNGFEIKISDMLKNRVTDTLTFDQKYVSDIKNLTEDGISGEAIIQSLDGESLLVTLNLEGTLREECDRCGTVYDREVKIEDYRAKYVSQMDPDGSDKEEEILIIDNKNGVIDLEEAIYHAIKLEEPIVKRCPVCEKAVLEEEDDFEER